MSRRFETAMTTLMALSAIAVATEYLFFSQSPPPPPETAVISVADSLRVWEHALPHVARGERVPLVEFVDVECPYCAQYHHTLDTVRSVLGDTVDIRLLNFPLSGHRFARSGAAAVACAFRDGFGEIFVSEVFANRDSIGFWPWTVFANHAGAVDTARFRECTISPTVLASVDAARLTAIAAGATGTPTIMVGGWRYSAAPGAERLLLDIRNVARGKALR